MHQKADCANCLAKLRLYADNELTPLETAGVLSHTQQCAACKAALAALENSSKLLRLNASYYTAPPALVARVSRLHKRTFAAQCLRFAVPPCSAAALALAAVLYLSTPDANAVLANQIVAAQVRALQEHHLMDVASTDQHTVKPWFEGRIDFSPPVNDFAIAGYPLIGGRLDYLNGQRAAALVYRRHKHVINVLVTKAQGGLADMPLRTLSVHGYNIVLWRKNHLSFAAVSDVNAAELKTLCELIADKS